MTTTTVSRRPLTIGAAALLVPALAHPTAVGYARPASMEISTEGQILETFETLMEWLATKIEELGVPGAAVGVTFRGQRFTRGMGIANVDSGLPFSPTTPFGIASLTKIFTATALASLAHNGALRLGDPVRRHLPNFTVADPEATEAITVAHLLSHTGGWADVLEPETDQDSLDWYVANLHDAPQVVPVGTHFSYSNSGFLVAGAVAEQVTGVCYEDAILELVLHPLGMTRTTFARDREATGNAAVGHELIDDTYATLPPAEIPRAVHPSAGIVSTIDDMLTFVEAHATIDPGRLDPEELASMRRPLATGGSLGPVIVDQVGVGWMLLDTAGETVLMSQGGDSGLISAMVAVPSREFGMIVCANSDAGMMLANDAVLRGLAEFVDLALPEPHPYTLTGDEAADAEGRYEIPGWLTIDVAPDDGSLQLSTSAGGHEIPEMSGRFTMVSARTGFMPYLGGRMWVDLVPDDSEGIRWLRFAGRLAPRVG